ncbi:MAG: winged helix-turn-helix transcriptional regulator [Erysipelotrichaceae bacterium]|jgi:pseudouridine kinase|nr:winged helix-turn-helix transcriptional regulator [Erysipelotrichaceae bacterium]
MLTDKESEVLALLAKNPQLSQKELARLLQMTRSSLSVHINNLTKKGYISGRGYVLNEPDMVTIIGSANMDIIGFCTDAVVANDSNPGKVRLCSGGVSRNIAENLARLQVPVRFITALGDDLYGRQILDECTALKIDMTSALVQSAQATSTYMAILDEQGEMALALSDMSILDTLPLFHLQSVAALLKRAPIIVMDAGLPSELMEYVLTITKQAKTFLDPVSIGKAKGIKHLVGQFHTLKLNRMEAEYLSGHKIEGPKDYPLVSKILLDQGVKRVFLTLGAQGVYYTDGENSGQLVPKPVQIVNATGAGDAFMAGVIDGTLKQQSLYETARFATAMSRLALTSASTVSPLISRENVLRNLEDKQM